MSSTMRLPIADASASISGALREELARTAGDRRRRHLVRLVDLAVDRCEQANLSAPGADGGPGPAVPVLALRLVEWLQAEAGEAPRRPMDSREALNELFRLQEVLPFLPGEAAEGGDDDEVHGTVQEEPR